MPRIKSLTLMQTFKKFFLGEGTSGAEGLDPVSDAGSTVLLK